MFKAKNISRKITDIPEPSMGAPIPMVVGDEYESSICYYLHKTDPDWDGSTCRLVGKQTNDLTVAMIRFSGVQSYKFGPPDETSQHTHPLRPTPESIDDYIHAFEAFESPCKTQISRDNKIRHIVLFFHDSTFEILADNYEIAVYENMSVLEACQIEIDRWSKE